MHLPVWHTSVDLLSAKQVQDIFSFLDCPLNNTLGMIAYGQNWERKKISQQAGVEIISSLILKKHRWMGVWNPT
jgi:hypothetical protein